MSQRRGLKLNVLSERLAVCRLASGAAVPEWAQGGFVSITRTDEELSIVCGETQVPHEIRCEHGWRALQVAGPLEFSLTGILSSIAAPLAENGVSIFAISTFDTDYVLVKDAALEEAVRALTAAGHVVERR